MNYNVQLSNGQIIELRGTDFDASAFTIQLNESNIVFVNLGGAIVNKHLISSILPSQD